MSNVTFVGGGSFGTALAVLLADKGNKVTMYCRNDKTVDEINSYHTNKKYLKNAVIPDNVVATNNLEKSLSDAKYVVFAVPSSAIRLTAKLVAPFINEKSIVISIAKGIEEGTNKRLSVVLEEELNRPVVVLSGPSHAEEVIEKLPTTVVATSNDMNYAEMVQDLFMNDYFRVYTNSDVIGVEIGGAVKNIIALGAGIIDGLGYGDNTRAALMTRGMTEIVRVGEVLGGKKETFYGLTGMGDLIVTCTSVHSRNRRAGMLIAKGKTLDEVLEEIGMVVEGVVAIKAFHELEQRVNVSMPITNVLYMALFENKDPVESIKELMVREKKSE